MSGNLTLGRLGEAASISYLRSLGYKILDKNIKLAIGEVDIIAQKNSTLYIFEVKTRKVTVSGNPYEAVTPQKAHKLIIMGEKYSLQKKLNHSKLSLGVIAVLIDENDKISSIKIYDYFI